MMRGLIEFLKSHNLNDKGKNPLLFFSSSCPIISQNSVLILANGDLGAAAPIMGFPPDILYPPDVLYPPDLSHP